MHGRRLPTAGGTVNSGRSFTGTVPMSGTDNDGVITLVAAFLRAGLTLRGFAGGNFMRSARRRRRSCGPRRPRRGHRPGVAVGRLQRHADNGATTGAIPIGRFPRGVPLALPTASAYVDGAKPARPQNDRHVPAGEVTGRTGRTGRSSRSGTVLHADQTRRWRLMAAHLPPGPSVEQKLPKRAVIGRHIQAPALPDGETSCWAMMAVPAPSGCLVRAAGERRWCRRRRAPRWREP
jgi:hypothetical protein